MSRYRALSLNTADNQCYKNGRCNNTQVHIVTTLAVTHCHVLNNLNHPYLTL